MQLEFDFDLGTLPGGVPYEVWPDATGAKAVIYDSELNQLAEITGLGKTGSQMRTNMLALAQLIEAATRAQEMEPAARMPAAPKRKGWW